MFSQFDHSFIAGLCEKVGLFQHALENYSNVEDVKRILINGEGFDLKWVVDYFNNLEENDSLTILKDLLSAKPNSEIALNVCTRHYERIGISPILDLFERFCDDDFMYKFLHNIVDFSQDSEVHFKFIVQATKLKQFKEVERICKDSNFYDPEKVKNFLKDAHLPDQLPLIIVCDRFNFVGDLTTFLVKNNLIRFVEIYVQKVNPQRISVVVGTLLDLDVSEDVIKKMIFSVKDLISFEELIQECELRGRLSCLKDVLKHFIENGNQSVCIHNAFAKILIDTNDDGAEQFLKTSDFYNAEVVGSFCEKRDAQLAYLIYEKGSCDVQLVTLCQENAMFRNLGRYLVHRMDTELWSTVLKKDNPHLTNIIENVIDIALPETDNSEMVFVTVKSFMICDLQLELIDLLEKLILNDGIFSEDKNLQNLLILTAIKVKKEKVSDYVSRLSNYDALDIANIAIGNELFEEAFEIYDKFAHNVNAVSVLLNNLNTIPRAVEYAEKHDLPEVWSEVGIAQLSRNMVEEAISCFIKSKFTNNYKEVIERSKASSCFAQLIPYLKMARQLVRDSCIDFELLFSFAKENNLDQMEEFLSQQSASSSFESVGSACFEEQLYSAAKIIFTYTQNYGLLAKCHIQLKDYQAAVDAARKANSIKIWKYVCEECVTVSELRLAGMCGLHIIVHPEELQFVTKLYQAHGCYEPLISLLESGIGLERAHKGIFTELGVIYCKYKQEKLIEHVKLFWTRFNVTKVIQACKEFEQWTALALLYSLFEDFDNCILCMIGHPLHAFEHISFKDSIRKVTNHNILYEALEFYVFFKPELLNDFLYSVSTKIDLNRLVDLAHRYECRTLLVPFFKSVQNSNAKTVNETLNTIFIEEEDFNALASSVSSFDNFDHFKLCSQLENHELLEFRRIAATLYKQNKKWKQSLELSKKDGLYKDAILTASQSKSTELCEELLQFFLKNNLKEHFSSSLFCCYDFINPDFVLELCWKHTSISNAFPYFIQVVHDLFVQLKLIQNVALLDKDD
eukprot:GCRY01003145.1.p1 GENE.GCRY01003145.1~~GCRY01003145.1.p1  ORF type:complete len:1173 (+),score=154.15 GCRY01003145.1:458-3520(+)